MTFQPIPTRLALGAALRDARKAKGLTQQELADSTRIAQPTVSNAERGESNVRIETLFGLLAALELELIIRPRKLPSATGPWDEEA
jgi:HTH-type transcriptional regulator/antitoxin HipB